MNTTIVKKSVSFALALVMVLGTMFVSNIGFAGIVSAETTEPEVEAVSYWTGNAANAYKEGSGTVDSPYIIETADQLYKMVTSSGKLSGGETAYYKVADGVTDIYLNDADTLGEIKALVEQDNYKNWETDGTSFYGDFNGNGVTIHGMVSYKTGGFIAKMLGDAAVKNVTFDSCYAYGEEDTAIVTTYVGYWNNAQTLGDIVISNVSVVNSHIESTRSTASGQSHSPTAGGIVTSGWTPKSLKVINCLFDGYSCELLQGSESTSNATGGIISINSSLNNVTIQNCVSLGATISSQSTGTSYPNYNNSQLEFKVEQSYSDCEESVKSTGAQKIATKAKYTTNDLSALGWGNQWQLVTTTDGADKFDGVAERTIPMPVTKFAEAEQPGQQDPIISGGETPEYPAPDVTPTPIDKTPYVNQIMSQSIGEGAQSVIGGPYYKGEYGMYDKLAGSGTEQDPYLITTPFELARAIASGGVNVDNRLYYKLACDIDAGNVEWIRQGTATNSSFNKYVYIAFGGILDGDGHTVSGISITRSDEVGLIPVLAADGVVKNLHLRDSNIKSTASYAGGIAGKVAAGGSVIGCSVENSVIESANAGSYIVGQSDNGAVKNSYYTTADNAVYYNTDGTIGDIDVSQNNDIWYCGGKDDSTPKLKNYAISRKFADIDGDGIADEYTALDLVALKKGILALPDYQNIYGDVNRDGITNIADLAILSRSIVGSYDKLYDGFWRNAALGKINIYYGENDNYDAARKLEIYLEDQLGGVDIKKYVSAKSTVSGENSDKNSVYVHQYDGHQKPKGTLEIIVGNLFNYNDYKNDEIGINDYSITYDDQKCVLWLNGGSFTGVEQAVLDFIANSDEKTGKVYTVEKATLSPEKQPKQVKIDSDYDGVLDTTKTFYYAWGDEFDGFKTHETDEEPLLSQDNWMVIDFNSETRTGGYSSTGFYNNVEAVNEKEMSKLYQITDGVLSIKRGVVSSKANATTDLMGYARLDNQIPGTTNALGCTIESDDIYATAGQIKTQKTMLYKQGYAEIYASLPSDGHAFPSWWMRGHGGGWVGNTWYSETLYSKVYKLNNKGPYKYSGKNVVPDSKDLTTFKYKVPPTNYEVDIWELMQNQYRLSSSYQRKNRLTGVYDYMLEFNVHKYYDVGAISGGAWADTVNIIDWDNPDKPIATVSRNMGAGNYMLSGKQSTYTFGTSSNYSFDAGLHKKLTAPRRYGFYWSTDGVDKLTFTIYIYDVNGDGVEDDNSIKSITNLTFNNEGGYNVVSDAETANQYMYMIFDNAFYTSNALGSGAMYTDLLTDNGTGGQHDKVTLDIDYIRVYQQDGRRDIITPETEDFNNGNHFGY